MPFQTDGASGVDLLTGRAAVEVAYCAAVLALVKTIVQLTCILLTRTVTDLSGAIIVEVLAAISSTLANCLIKVIGKLSPVASLRRTHQK